MPAGHMPNSGAYELAGLAFQVEPELSATVSSGAKQTFAGHAGELLWERIVSATAALQACH